MTGAPPPPPSRWRLIAIILAALPTMLIAGLACWILTGFLNTRDRLGHWHLTVRDDGGAEIGHGDMDLDVDHWAWWWTSRPPFLRCKPNLGTRTCGTLTLSAPAMEEFGATQAAVCALTCPQFALLPNGGLPFAVVAELPSARDRDWCFITWPGEPGPDPGRFQVPSSGANGPHPTFTVTLTR
jgi:hypothetical protein